MIEVINIVVGILLFVALVLDIKFSAVPSVFLSGLLFAVAILNFQNIHFGLLALAYAWFLMDAEFIGGMADVKVMGIIGLFIPNMFLFLMFVALVVVMGTFYKIVMHYALGGKYKGVEIPFIPVLFIVYMAIIDLQVGWI